MLGVIALTGARCRAPNMGSQMTNPLEQKWLAGRHTDPMLTRVTSPQLHNLRKLRLFAVACCRRVWDSLPTEGHRALVVVLEDYLEGKVAWKTVQAKRKPVLTENDRSFAERVIELELSQPGDPSNNARNYGQCPRIA